MANSKKTIVVVKGLEFKAIVRLAGLMINADTEQWKKFDSSRVYLFTRGFGRREVNGSSYDLNAWLGRDSETHKIQSPFGEWYGFTENQVETLAWKSGSSRAWITVEKRPSGWVVTYKGDNNRESTYLGRICRIAAEFGAAIWLEEAGEHLSTHLEDNPHNLGATELAAQMRWLEESEARKNEHIAKTRRGRRSAA